MAPFTISPHHPLSYQCHLPQTAPYQQSKMSLGMSSTTTGTAQDLPLIPDGRMSIFSMLLKIRLHLWRVIQRLLICCTSELFSSMFLFICVGKSTAMMGELKKNGVVEAQERPGGEFIQSVLLDEKMKDPEMELNDEDSSTPAESQWSMDEEEDEGQLSEWESEEETDEEEEEDEEHPPHEETECDDGDDSDWSDDDDDDDDDDEDSEASAESVELWESFFNSSDPYNPLSFTSCTGSRTNPSTNKNHTPASLKITPTPAIDEEEHYPKPSTEKGKQVRFIDEVTVRPLVAWSFACRAARDGSCWMRMARDRERFRRRAESVGNIITSCFTPEHRADVWKRLQRETLI